MYYLLTNFADVTRINEMQVYQSAEQVESYLRSRKRLTSVNVRSVCCGHLQLVPSWRQTLQHCYCFSVLDSLFLFGLEQQCTKNDANASTYSVWRTALGQCLLTSVRFFYSGKYGLSNNRTGRIRPPHRPVSTGLTECFRLSFQLPLRSHGRPPSGQVLYKTCSSGRLPVYVRSTTVGWLGRLSNQVKSHDRANRRTRPKTSIGSN